MKSTCTNKDNFRLTVDSEFRSVQIASDSEDKIGDFKILFPFEVKKLLKQDFEKEDKLAQVPKKLLTLASVKTILSAAFLLKRETFSRVSGENSLINSLTLDSILSSGMRYVKFDREFQTLAPKKN